MVRMLSKTWAAILVGRSGYLAVSGRPFFDKPEPIVRAAFAGKPVQMLIGLNSATWPAAVAEVYKLQNVSAR
jgi:hypothetical protein